MNALQWLEAAANVSGVITAVVATLAYGRFLYERRLKRRRLETHLRYDVRRDGRTLLDLAATLGMTEIEIMDAAFRSRHIRRAVTAELYGSPSRMLLEYDRSAKDQQLTGQSRGGSL